MTDTDDGQHRAIWTSLRSMKPCPAVILLESGIGERFEGIVTGASDEGTRVRLLHPPILLYR